MNIETLRKIIRESIEESIVDEEKLLKRYDDSGRNRQYIQCNECGGTVYEGHCMECGSIYEDTHVTLSEGNCGCGTSKKYKLGDYEVLDNTNATKGDAFSVGHIVGKSHHDGAYMAKSQLYKVAKYAEKLYHIIPDGHNLQDWMRSKLAQIADDIGEVYHAIDHDRHEGDI